MKLTGENLFKEIGSKRYLLYMTKNKVKHIRIIAFYGLAKNYDFKSYQQVEFFIKRSTRAAKRLEVFEPNQIKRTIQYLIKNTDFKWTLETVEKYIMDMDNITGEDEDGSIITLRSGEQVSSIERLKELERQNKIYYTDGKWYERH